MPSTLKTVPEIRIHPGNAAFRLTGLISESPRMLPFLALFCALTVLGHVSFGREWSEEVQMTHVGDLSMESWTWRVDVDHNDVIHAAYTCTHVQDDSLQPWQPVYQKFNRRGEPLCEPLILGRVVDVRPPYVQVYDLEIDDNDNIHILWGTGVPYHTMLSNDGDILIPNARLEGITMDGGRDEDGNAVSDLADMVVVEDHIYLFTGARNYNVPFELQYHYPAFGRYEFDGSLVDTLILLQDRIGLISTPRIQVDSNGMKHFAWYAAIVNANTVYYSRMNADGEIEIDCMQLPSDDEDRLFYSRSMFSVDNHGGVYFSDQAPIGYLVRFDEDMNVDWRRYLARVPWGSRRGMVLCNSERGVIHDSEDYDTRNEEDGTSFIGYACFDEAGNTLDSLTMIHDVFPGGRPRSFDRSMLVNFSDGDVAVIWADNRYDFWFNEMFMLYSIPQNAAPMGDQQKIPTQQIQLSTHPNPFNTTVTIEYYTPVVGDYSLTITDTRGRQIWRRQIPVSSAGWRSEIWRGLDSKGRPVPSGTYTFSIQGEKKRVSKQLHLVR